MYTVYAIYNRRCQKIYIGQTEDLATRLKLHQEKAFENSFTSKFEGVWELIYSEPAAERKSALVREKQLKSYRGRQFLKQYIPV